MLLDGNGDGPAGHQIGPEHFTSTARNVWPFIPTAIDARDVSYIHYQGENAVIRLSLPV